MGFLACKGEGFPRTIGLLELKAECQVAKPTSGPETPADGAPYIFFVTGGAFEPVVTEVPPERKFNSADLSAFRRVRGDIVLSILMLAMALFLIASFAGETGWAKRKLPADMGQYIGIQLGLLDAEGRVARLGTILKQGWFAPMMCLVVMLPSAALNLAASWRATRKWKRQQMPSRWRYEVGQWARALEFIGYFALYTLAVPVLGYLLSTMILLPFLTFRLGYRSWYWLRVSGLVAFAIVLLFRTALQIKTPVNIWLYNQLPDAVGIFMKTWF